jgi:hypothetical protein
MILIMYYRVENRTDRTVGNVASQVTFDDIKEAGRILHEFLDLSVLNAKLDRRAKVTDVMSDVTIPAVGLLVNKKVREIFDQHNLMSHKYYPVEIEAKGDILHYDFFQPFDEKNLDSYIDFEKSSFEWRGFTIESSSVKLYSYKEYKEKRNTRGICDDIVLTDIVLKNTFSKEWDVFTFSPIRGGRYFFISEKLKNALEANNVSGIEYHPVTNIRFQEEIE